MTFDQFMSSPVLLAIAGACIGGMRAGIMSLKAHGRARAVSDGLIGIVFAVSMADWLTPPHYPKVAALIGLLAGTTGARALDATAELVPSVVREFWRELVLGLARKITGSSGVARRQTGWGDLRSRDDLPHRGPIDNPDGGRDEYR